jgi:two-component system, OmpR family, phosphate regulon sensor histidine kinase PhoR
MSKGRVLVVDDEYGIRSGVDQILEMEGYEVEEAETGKEALQALDRQAFDIVLIDYRLPDVDGLSLLQSIRGRKLDLMTCMITAYANIETAVAATRQGIDFFLPKPFSPEDLIGVTETLLRHKKLREEAEELKKAHEASLLALASEKSQTHSLVASLRDAVLVVNRDGEVVLANPAMGKLLGTEETNLLRKPATEVLGAEHFAPLRAALGSISREGTVFEIEMGDQQFMVSFASFHSEGGDMLGHIVTISDISEVRRLALEKSRFIRTMIHEFRSPMGAVKSILEVALDKSMGETLEPYLPLLGRAEKRLDGLVELIGNLLSLSRIEAEGRKRTAFEPADPSALVNEVVELFREKMESGNLCCEVKVDSSIPRIAVAGEDLKTVLVNLVGNAVKYNRDGGKVGVHASRMDGRVRIDVSDTGLGIRAENLPHIFDEFFREKRKETRDIEGNGLGLAIVRLLIERCSGKMEVQSTEGVGSTFSVYLPMSSPA